MFQRPLLFLAVLAAAGLVPYIMLDEQLSATARSQWNALSGGSSSKSESTVDPIDQLAMQWSQGGAGDASSMLVSQQHAPVPLEHALRFDVSLPWVTAVFPRVSTVLGETQLQGLRVPLVTGTQPHDIAGSLTYYFDREQVLRRITFQGYTGDDRRVVTFVCTSYGLVAQPTLERGLYRGVGATGETSTMLVRHTPVLTPGSPQQRIEVVIDLVKGPLPDGYKLPKFVAPGMVTDEVVIPNITPAEAAPVPAPPVAAAKPAAETPAAKPSSTSPRPTWRW